MHASANPGERRVVRLRALPMPGTVVRKVTELRRRRLNVDSHWLGELIDVGTATAVAHPIVYMHTGDAQLVHRAPVVAAPIQNCSKTSSRG